MKKKFADEIHIGKHQLGWREIDLYVQPYSSGGSFQAVPGDGRDAIMKIGMDHDCWPEVMEVILHEAHEFNLCDLGVGYRPQNVYSGNCSDGVFFMYNHNQHTEACARTAYFLANTIPLLASWYKKIKPTAK